MKKFASILFGMLIALAAGCGFPSNIDLSDGHVGVIYTDATKKDSEFVVLDKNGKVTDSHRIRKMGIFQIERGPRNEWLLPVRFDGYMAIIRPDGSLSETTVLDFPLDIAVHGDTTVTGFNTAFHYGTVELKDGKTSKKRELPGMLMAVSVDEEYVYVFGDINETHGKLYVLEKDRLEIHKEITLQQVVPDDILPIDGKILLTSRSDQSDFLTLVSKEDWSIRQINLPYHGPQYLLAGDEEIFVTYALGNHISVLDRNTLQIKRNIRTSDQAVLNVDMDSRHLYVLSQDQNDPNPTGNIVGRVGVYDKQTGKRVQVFELPNKRNMLVQDLIVIHPDVQ
ncbi:hypothetical protein [Staphylospora marina]|uniref:hypothetical protein n=1 Tax=Staphylospora marina TaxID=2490858 RepID=UPI000F5BF5E2|nr:hypothetical protein [Staphylospora marina]